LKKICFFLIYFFTFTCLLNAQEKIKYVYIGSYDEKMYCIDDETGKKVWEFKTGHLIESNPTVYKKRVYFASDDGKLYCLDAITGGKIWDKKIGEEFEYSSPNSFFHKILPLSLSSA